MNFFLIAIFFNIIPAIIIFNVLKYRVGWNEEFIFARPISKFGGYMKMKFEDLDVVDLRSQNSLFKRNDANSSPDVIVLYRKNWNGEEIFALDPVRTNLNDFEKLILNIYSRRPEAFTADALGYLRKFAKFTPPEPLHFNYKDKRDRIL